MPRLKDPIYVLPHGIEVIGEYAPNAKCPYWRVRVRPHPLIVGKIICNGIYTKRSKVVAAAMLGRVITDDEHVHHGNGREVDNPAHLEVLSAAQHNAHHKTGSKHRNDVKARISASLKAAYAEGRHAPTRPRDQFGEANPYAKLTRQKVEEIRASTLPDKVIAAQYGVSRRNIGMIRQGVTWK